MRLLSLFRTKLGNGNPISVEKHFVRGLHSDYTPTIYALSTTLARSAIGVIRISGSQSQYIFNTLTGTKSLPQHRKTSVRKLKSPENGGLLDEALTVFFNNPHSYTGEDLLELHVHGGVAIIKSILKEIKNLHCPEKGIHIRYAENGEFSQRAFVNGRFDLTELEGVREMIDAETETQRQSTLSSMQGETKRLFLQWRQEIVNNIALLTTVIDFGEDHDIDEVAELFDSVSGNVQKLKKDIEQYLHRVRRSEILLKGIKVALLGPPNAGKSSLLNVIANEDASIVSNIPGTTRDTIDIPMDVNGYKIVIGDTAGIREIETADEIEVEGIRRAKAKTLSSDLALIVLPLLDPVSISQEFIDHVNELRHTGAKVIAVINKEDLLTSNDPQKEELIQNHCDILHIDRDLVHVVSCKVGTGIEELVDQLSQSFKDITLTENSDPITISARAQDILINDVLYGIDQFEVWRHQDDVVLASESLNQASLGIGKITGQAIGIEEILGVVFSTFCIGK